MTAINSRSESVFPIKDLVQHIRSNEEDERMITISQIPTLILKSLTHKDQILDQLLLVAYNIHTDGEKLDVINLSNHTIVFRHLFRLYTQTIKEPKFEQTEALMKIIDLVHSSELLVELAYSLNQCTEYKLSKEHSELVEEALSTIKEKAAANLYLDALLMIHSIMAMK